MTQPEQLPNNITSMDLLVDTWEGVIAQMDSLREQKGRLEMAMEQAMTAENAEEFIHGDFIVTLKADKLWVEALLDPLSELIAEKGLNLDEYLSKPVARKYDKRKLNKLAKQGGKIREVIETAHVVGAPVLKVKKQ
jgi:hypothetical protein